MSRKKKLKILEENVNLKLKIMGSLVALLNCRHKGANDKFNPLLTLMFKIIYEAILQRQKIV